MIDVFVGAFAALVAADLFGAFVIGPLVRRAMLKKQQAARKAAMKQVQALQELFEKQQAEDQGDAAESAS